MHNSLLVVSFSSIEAMEFWNQGYAFFDKGTVKYKWSQDDTLHVPSDKPSMFHWNLDVFFCLRMEDTCFMVLIKHKDL